MFMHVLFNYTAPVSEVSDIIFTLVGVNFERRILNAGLWVVKNLKKLDEIFSSEVIKNLDDKKLS